MEKRLVKLFENKKLIYMVSVIIFLILSKTVPANAKMLIVDSFTDMTKVDTSNTTAEVDVTSGEVRLPKAAMPDAIAIRKESNEYAVVTDQGENFYSFDTETNQIALNESLSITGINGVKGIAMRQDKYAVWLITQTELIRYDLDKSTGKLEHNAYLSKDGMEENISISAHPYKDKVVILSKNNLGKGIITVYQGTAEGSLIKNTVQSFETEIIGAVAVSLIPDNEDIIVSAENEVYYYSFDKETSSYVINEKMSKILSSSSFNSIKGRENGFGYIIAAGAEAECYLYDKVQEEVINVPSLSNTFESKIVSLALKEKAGTYEYAALLEDSTVRYMKYDVEDGKMKEVSDMGVSGIENSSSGYISPAIYQSTVVHSLNTFNEAKITATEVKPLNTNITYKVSSDGGTTWTSITAGAWADIPEGNNLCIQAELSTMDPNVTPKILDIRVEAAALIIENLQVIAITLKHDDQPVPTDIFPVRVKSGSQVVYTVETDGYAEQVTAQFSTGYICNMYSNQPVSEEENTWIGTFTVMPDIPDGTIIDVILTARRGSKSKQLALPVAFIYVDSTIIFDIDLLLDQ